MKRFRLIEEPSTQFDKETQPELWEGDRIDYIACIRQVIRAPQNPQAGVGMEEMEKGIRVLTALKDKTIGDMLALEDADHAHLCGKVRASRWAVVDERLVRFMHTVLDAVEHPVDEDRPETSAPPSGLDC